MSSVMVSVSGVGTMGLTGFSRHALSCEAADIIVVPFAYDFGYVDATRCFAKVLKGMSKAQLFFIPNSINLNEEKSSKIEKNRLAAHNILDMYGKMTPRIKQSIVAHQYSTISPLSYYQRKLVEYAFDMIVEHINK